jgi:hypothetical protein
MTPTHILVPIEWVDDLIESYRKIPSWAWDDGDVQGMKILNQIKDLPKVDLSEEGIKSKGEAMIEGANPTFNMTTTDKTIMGALKIAAFKGYLQCAKDLLNTKP